MSAYGYHPVCARRFLLMLSINAVQQNGRSALKKAKRAAAMAPFGAASTRADNTAEYSRWDDRVQVRRPRLLRFWFWFVDDMASDARGSPV